MTTHITKLAITIETSTAPNSDGRNAVDLNLGYYSTFGRIPLFKTVRLFDAGKYIGSALEKVLEVDKGLPDDIATLFSLELTQSNNYNEHWRPGKVAFVEATLSDGSQAMFVQDQPLDGTSNAQKFFAEDEPAAGTRGLMVNSKNNYNYGTPEFEVKARQMLTIRADSLQRWRMGNVECNPEGPLRRFDDPFLTHQPSWGGTNCAMRPFTFVRGALVMEFCHQHGGYWVHQYMPVGTFLEVPVLVDGRVRLTVWDNSFADNEGQIGVEISITDVDYNRFNRSLIPTSATSYKLKPQDIANVGGALYDTGLDLEVGQTLHIRADPYDTWKISGSSVVNANGEFSSISGIDNPGSATWNWWFFARGALLGTVDDGATYFPVGHHLDMSVQQRGRLKLTCWDNSAGDNTGEISASIWTSEGNYAPPSLVPVAAQAKITIATIKGGGDEYVELANDGDSDADLQGLTLIAINASYRCQRQYNFVNSEVLRTGETIKIWANKPGERHSFNSDVPLFYGQGDDRVLLVRVLMDKMV